MRGRSAIFGLPTKRAVIRVCGWIILMLRCIPMLFVHDVALYIYMWVKLDTYVSFTHDTYVIPTWCCTVYICHSCIYMSVKLDTYVSFTHDTYVIHTWCCTVYICHCVYMSFMYIYVIHVYICHSCIYMSFMYIYVIHVYICHSCIYMSFIHERYMSFTHNTYMSFYSRLTWWLT